MAKLAIEARGVNVFYGDKQALHNIDLDIPKKSITALIGPSGCGKSTFLRSLNRMNDTVEGCRVTGEIRLDKKDIYSAIMDPVALRAKVGMVFQKPNPFPKSIADNILYGPRIHGMVHGKKDEQELVRECLKKVGLWSEVRDRLTQPATGLSGGQQQRLCIARTIAVQPEVILMDEPCSALDPIATAKIEKLMMDLAKDYTIVIVTHSMQQARRISSKTAFFYLGDLIEVGSTKKLFEKPKEDKTKDYISGQYG